MPIYVFKNEETGEVVEVFLGMNDKKEYNGENGTETGKWRRVFLSPNANVDGNINPHSAKDFCSKTRGKNMTYGEVMDLSKELSEKREEKHGIDEVKVRYLEEHKSKRRGKCTIKVSSKYQTKSK